MTPLDVFLRDADEGQAGQVIRELGAAIRELADAEVFPGDILCKNFRGHPLGACGVLRLRRDVFLHRFGAALIPHFHFHVVVLDGVFSQTDDGEVQFHEATLLQPDHGLELQHVVQRRVLDPGEGEKHREQGPDVGECFSQDRH